MKPSATLVIPDIHNDFTRAEAFIAHLAGRYHEVLFLGDYFDDFGDTREDTARVAEWLLWSMVQSNRTHLVGNHDLAYLVPNSFTCCSGFEPDKMRAAAPILNQLPRELFRAAVEIHGWLFSHAGFHPSFTSGRTGAQLVNLANDTLQQLAAGGTSSLFAAGLARGGSEPIGGITWLDWREFRPTAGIHQMVGHSPAATVRLSWLEAAESADYRREYGLNVLANETVSRSGLASLNVCLDTRLKCVGLVDGDTITVITERLPDGEESATAFPASL